MLSRDLIKGISEIMNAPTQRPYQMWNEYGLSNICFQLLVIHRKVKALDAVRQREVWAHTCKVTAFVGTEFCVTLMFCEWKMGCWKCSSAQRNSLRRREKITLLLRGLPNDL